MEDMISRLSSILDDPEQAEKIKRIATSIMSDNSAEKQDSNISENSGENLPVMAQTITPTQSNSYNKLLSSMNSSKNVSLLNALRPYMRSSRAEKIGSAIKAMEMIELLSKLK